MTMSDSSVLLTLIALSYNDVTQVGVYLKPNRLTGENEEWSNKQRQRGGSLGHELAVERRDVGCECECELSAGLVGLMGAERTTSCRSWPRVSRPGQGCLDRGIP